jgi:hypothetical protein
MISLSSVAFSDSLLVAKNIYTTLWNKPLDPSISNSSIELDGTVISYHYFEQTLISGLELSRLKFREDILLIPNEYTVAYESMQQWTPWWGRCHWTARYR